jgi:acyl-CoA thioester hydrolase
MHEINTSTFQVRQYECDALGHLNNANYLRYMQESTLDALASVGCDLARLLALGCAWRSRNIYIEYLRPLEFGDVVRVNTWNEAFAVAQMEFIIVDVTNDQEVPIPIEIRKDLISLERSEQLANRQSFPPASPPPLGAFSMAWRVEWRDVDSAQRLNSAAYLDYLLDFVLRAAADCGWSHELSLKKGLLWVVRRQWLNILQHATLEDELLFTTWISDFKRSTVTRQYAVHLVKDDILMAEARTLWVAIDRESGRPMRIPEEWKQDFAPQISIS